MDEGRGTMDARRRTAGGARWTMDDGPRTTDDDAQAGWVALSGDRGLRCMVRGLFGDRGLRCMVRGLWPVFCVLLLTLAGCGSRATEVVVQSPAPTVGVVEVLTPEVLIPPTSSVGMGPATPAPTVVSPELAKANDLAVSSRIEDAVALYASLARADRSDARPEIGWAWALIYDDEPGEALPHAQRAVDLDAQSSEAWAVLSRAYAGIGDGAGAMTAALEASALEIDSAQARAALAEAHLLRGERLAALRAAERALELGGTNPDAHRIRARVYQSVEDKPDRAAAELQVAAAYQPQLWLRRHELGLVLLEAGYPSVAALAFEDALRLRPEGVSYAGLGKAEYEQQQYEQAQSALARAIDLGLKDAATYGYLAASYAWLGECDEVDGLVRQSLALDSSQAKALEAGEVCRGAVKATSTPEVGPSPTVVPTRAAAALGGRIAFPVWNDASRSYEVYLAQVKDGQRTLVVGGMHQPALSPDGQWLAVNGERENFVLGCLVRPDGSNLMEITNFAEDGQPAWSSDGNRLAFASFRDGGDRQPRIYLLDGIPWGGGRVDGREIRTGQDAIRGEMPAWTADGEIVYRGCGLDSPEFGCNGRGLQIVSGAPVAVSPRQLTDQPGDSRPAVYGSRVAFMSDRDGDWEIYVVNLDGSGLKQLTKNSANDGLPAWSPDGARLAFVSDDGGAWAVWAMAAEGGSLRKLFELGGGLGRDWVREQIGWGP